MRVSLKIYGFLIVCLCLLFVSGFISELFKVLRFGEEANYGTLVINIVGLCVLLPSLYYIFLLTQRSEFDGNFLRQYQHKKIKEVKLGSDTTIAYGFFGVCISENGKSISLPRSAQSFSIMEKIYEKVAITKIEKKAPLPYEYHSINFSILFVILLFLVFSFVLVEMLRSILIVSLVVYLIALLYVLIFHPYVVRISYDGIELISFLGLKKKISLQSITSARTDILIPNYRLILILKVNEKECTRKVVVGINGKKVPLDELVNFFGMNEEMNSIRGGVSNSGA